MRRIGIFLLIPFALALFISLASRDRGIQPQELANKDLGSGAEAQGLLTHSIQELASSSLSPESRTQSGFARTVQNETYDDDAATTVSQDGSAEPPDWEYENLFGGRFAAESVDPTWAPQLAATIDNTIRSMGGYIADVNVDCRTTQCGAVVLYQPSFFLLDEATAEKELSSLLERFNTLQIVVDASFRLTGVSALGLAALSRELPGGANPGETTKDIGTVVHFLGGPLEDRSD